jgi:3-hydroxyacyl-CoA dehydrogenase/enoyl-CoA hydratase/3-hydroxybutyryl-CoA epimerase
MRETVGINYTLDGSGLLWVVFDRPGESVNLLDASILEALDRLLDDLRARPDVRGVLFSSAKPGMFIAGMDVEQIASVTGSQQGADGARFGQAVFQKIAELPIPSVSVIRGTCLGGGTELALACSFRTAADDGALRIGLPEVQLGIIPGFGGTQRLPHRVGLPAALEMILTGRSLNARRARKIGLVDLLAPPEYLDRESTALIERAIADGTKTVARSLRRGRWAAGAFERIGPLRRYVLGQARKRAAAKANPDDYPAPFRALEAVDIAYTRSLPEGLDYEARVVGELIPNRTAKNLMWLFKTQTVLKGSREGSAAVPRKVRRIAVLGAGIMGGGIAQLAADKRISVRLKDLQYDAILTALRTADGIWNRRVERRRMTRGEKWRRISYIAPTTGDSGLAQVDLVIEAVVENLEVKQRVLADLEQRIDERAVFASNTSSLPISEIAARALRPERVVGMHFFNPVHRMPLVEVIAGKKSSPEAVATVRELAIKLGKIPIVVKDGPGFLVNRILTFYLNEAARLLTDGLKIEAIDGAMIGFGMPMGPLALLDQVGLDTAKHVGDVLTAALGKRAEGNAALLNTLINAGKLGTKNGRGFYRYRGGKRGTPDGETYRLIGSPTPRDLPPETLQERMVLAMINEAAFCLEEGVVKEPRDVDIAMVMGTGFPPFRGGLLRYADSVGIPIVADRLSRLAEAQGEQFRPADLLGLMVREQRRFYGTR